MNDHRRTKTRGIPTARKFTRAFNHIGRDTQLLQNICAVVDVQVIRLYSDLSVFQLLSLHQIGCHSRDYNINADRLRVCALHVPGA